MTIVGSKRMIVYDDVAPLEKIRIFDTRVERPPHYDTFGEFHYAYHYGDMYAPYIKQEEPLKAGMPAFSGLHPQGSDAADRWWQGTGTGPDFGGVFGIVETGRCAGGCLTHKRISTMRHANRPFAPQAGAILADLPNYSAAPACRTRKNPPGVDRQAST